MPAPQFHMWFFPDIQTVDGNLEVRIFRLDQQARDMFNSTFGGGATAPNNAVLNPYLWENYFPADCIHLDGTRNSDIINYDGLIDYSTIDELAGIRIAKATVDFNDKEGFSGVNGNGNVIFWQELFGEGKTLSQHIFNDKSDKVNYILWTTLFDTKHPREIISYTPDQDQFLKVTFIGDIDKNNMPDQPILIRNDSNPSNLLRVPIIKLNCVPCYDRMLKYKMRDLLWNHFQDGNKSLTLADTDGYPRVTQDNNVGFMAGFELRQLPTGGGNVNAAMLDFNTAAGTTGADGNPLNPPADDKNIANAIIDKNNKIHGGAQEYLSIHHLTAWRAFREKANNNGGDPNAVFSAFNGNYSHAGVFSVFNLIGCNILPGANFTLWNCGKGSFRNGWHGISLNTIIKKIASFTGCDPNILAQYDRTISGGDAEWDRVANGYACISRCGTQNMNFVTPLEGVFGIDPRGQGVYKTSQGQNNSIRVTTLFMFDDFNNLGADTAFAQQNQIPLVDGQQVFVENINFCPDGIYTVQNVTRDNVQGDLIPKRRGGNTNNICHQDFDLIGTTFSGSHDMTVPGTPLATVNTFFSTPVTYSESDHLDAFIKDTLWQFGLKLKFPITQSGTSIGMPFMNFVSRWRKGKPIPANAKAGTKFHKQPRKITSDCIKVSQRGDSGYCICPPNGKLPPIEVPALRWRTHQYGSRTAVFPPNLVFDSASGKNMKAQNETKYGYYTFGDNSNEGISLFGYSLAESNGWTMLSYLYEPYIDAPNSNPRYPPQWNNWCDVNDVFNDQKPSNWSGHPALQTLMWNPSGGFGQGLSPLPNQFNPMFDIARLAALEFISNKEMYDRDFIGLTYLDDPDDEYEDFWQEGGKQVPHRMGNRIYNQIIGAWVSSEWVASPIDKNGNLNYDTLDNAPDVVFYNGASTGAGGSSSSTTGSGVSGSNTINNQWDTTKTRRVLRRVDLYSSAIVRKTFQVEVEESFDAVSGKWIAQFGTTPPYEAQTLDNFGFNSKIFFHYQGKPGGGAEIGNCYIDGLSPTGPNVPDYWFSFQTQVKRVDTTNASMNYALQNGYWSEDKNDWIMQRLLQVANPNLRMYVSGRFHCEWDNVNSKFTNFIWKDFTSPEYTFSNDECKNDSDLGIIGASRTLPTLAGGANATIDILWNSRVKPVAIECLGIFEYARPDTDPHPEQLVFPAIDIQMGTLPCRNRVCTTVPASAANGVNIGWWINNFAAAVGTRHIQRAGTGDIHTALLADPLGLWTVTFWGTCDIIGEDATTS